MGMEQVAWELLHSNALWKKWYIFEGSMADIGNLCVLRIGATKMGARAPGDEILILSKSNVTVVQLPNMILL